MIKKSERHLMTKTFVSVMIIMLFTTCIIVSHAEDANGVFSLRKGIIFGDSKKQVQEKEELPLELEVTEEGDEKLVSEHTTIAGVEDSYIVYQFGTNDSLSSVTYNFRSGLTGNIEATALVRGFDFSDIDDGLTIKYGEPMTEDDEFADIDSKAQSSMDALIALEKYMNKGKQSTFGKTGTERVINLDEGIIKIEHYIYVMGEELQLHQLRYEFFSNEQIGRRQAPRDPGQTVTDDL